MHTFTYDFKTKNQKDQFLKEKEEFVNRCVSRLRYYFIKEHSYYSEALCSLADIKCSFEKTNTVCTDGWNIYINPIYLSTLEEGELNFVLLHEMFHVLYFHAFRRGLRDPMIWNIAADCIVNWTILRHVIPCLNNKFLTITPDPYGSYLFKHPFNSMRIPSYDKLSNLDNVTTEQLYRCFSTFQRKDDAVNKGNEGNRKTAKFDLHTCAQLDVYHDLPVIYKDGIRFGNNYKKFYHEIYIPENDLLDSNDDDFNGKEIIDRVENIVRRIKTQHFNEKVSCPNKFASLENNRMNWKKCLNMTCMHKKEYIQDVYLFIESSSVIFEKNRFLFIKQAHAICREYSCSTNVVYWRDEINSIYENISNPKDAIGDFKDIYGPTNLYCVFQYIQENWKKLQNAIFLICTHGNCDYRPVLSKKIRSRTIIALSNELSDKISYLKEYGTLVNLR